MAKLQGFKVLRHNRTSAFITGKAARVYPKRRIVEPKEDCGPLAVFDTAEHAKKFVSEASPQMMLWRMKPNSRGYSAIGEVPCSPIIVKCWYQISEFSSLWCMVIKEIPSTANAPTYERGLFRQVLSCFPTGTVLAKSITCIE